LDEQRDLAACEDRPVKLPDVPYDPTRPHQDESPSALADLIGLLASDMATDQCMKGKGWRWQEIQQKKSKAFATAEPADRAEEHISPSGR
jgi:hypothetical protein